MLGPEKLYQLNQKDVGVPWLECYIRRAIVAAALVTVDAQLPPIDAGRILILNHAACTFGPGAAQNLVSAYLAVQSPDQVILLKWLGVAGAVNIIGSLDWQGQLFVPPGFNVRARGIFNAGGVVNTLTLDGGGLQIPRATITS